VSSGAHVNAVEMPVATSALESVEAGSSSRAGEMSLTECDVNVAKTLVENHASAAQITSLHI
jgi:hypothetical protein